MKRPYAVVSNENEMYNCLLFWRLFCVSCCRNNAARGTARKVCASYSLFSSLNSVIIFLDCNLVYWIILYWMDYLDSGY